MATVSSLGIGSGLDLASIVEGLVNAERAPTESRLSRKSEDATTQLSAFGALRSSLSLFQGSLGSLKFKTSLSEQSANVSDSSVLSVDLEASASTGNFDVEVTALSARHSLATNPATAFSDISDTIGTGTLTLRFGTTTTSPYGFTEDTSKSTQTITVSEENNNTTVIGFRNYINENDFGVEASVINDGSGYRIVLTSEETGAANSMEITVSSDGDSDDTDNLGLSQLAFNATAQSSSVQTVAAQDASLTINGLAITRENNTVTGAIDGVTLNLTKADVGNPISVSIEQNYNQAKSGIREVVDGYNALVNNIQSLTSYNQANETAGILIGDFTVRNMANQLENTISGLVSSSANIRSLADVGITTQSNGTLSIDEDVLAQAFEDFPDEVEALFINQGKATDSNITYLTSNSGIDSGQYPVFIETLATQGSYVGGVVNTLTIDADNDRFTILVDGTQSESITLTQAAYGSGEELAQHIQAQINGDPNIKGQNASVEVTYDSDNNQFNIASSLYGSSSKIEIESIDTNTEFDLGFTLGQGIDGSNVEGTIDGLPATGSGQILTAQSILGISVQISGESTGFLGSVNISKGIVSSIDNLLDGLLLGNGLIKSREDNLNEKLQDIVIEREELESRITSLEARYIKQFSALDSLIAQFNSTSSFLTTQLDNLVDPNTLNR
jgi:flagellar hook-associated protein 2